MQLAPVGMWPLGNLIILTLKTRMLFFLLKEYHYTFEITNYTAPSGFPCQTIARKNSEILSVLLPAKNFNAYGHEQFN